MTTSLDLDAYLERIQWGGRSPIRCQYMVDNFQAQLSAAIEKRVREQLARRLQVDPNADLPKIIDIQIGQERERLELQALEYEDAGGDRRAELVRMLIDDWLPELAQQLKRR